MKSLQIDRILAKPLRKRNRSWGFTMVEILFVLGVIAILGGVAVVAISEMREGTRNTKLASDVATLNAAVQVYETHGGNLGGASSVNEVLSKLKSQADPTSAGRMLGLRSNMVDLRLAAEFQSATEGQSAQERAIWNSTRRRFEIRRDGAVGVKNFVLNDEEAATDPATESRSSPIQAGGDGWVWDYADAASASKPGFGNSPGTQVVPPRNPLVAPSALQLDVPMISQSGGNHPLINFDLSVTLSNPNPPGTSQIFYSIDGGGFSLYKGETITVPPGMKVSAYAATSDPDHWYNSGNIAHTYQPIPVQLQVAVDLPKSSLTYAEAGGRMMLTPVQTPPAASVRILNTNEIPSRFLTSEKFRTFYGYQGSNPLVAGTEGPAFSGNYISPSIPLGLANWGTSPSLVVSAAAKALDTQFFSNSPVASATVTIAPTSMATPVIDPPSGTKAADLPVSILLAENQNYPVGSRIYYTMDGTDPGSNGGEPTKGFLYTGQFNSGKGTNGVVVVTSRVYGPAGYGHWFTPSPVAANTYISITFPEGALVGSASLNGTFVGSLMYAIPANGSMNSINFNSGAKILSGNLYLPGTPNIRLTSGVVWSSSNDASFANYILGWEYNAFAEKTVRTTPRVLNDTGNALPNNYTVSFSDGAIVEGKVIRRYDAPAFPVIAAPPPADSNRGTSFNSAPATPVSASQYSSISLNSNVGDVRLLAGNYSNLTANSETAFVLGDPNNPEVTQVYSFETLNLNSGSDLKIVGKVIVTVRNQININSGTVLGNAAHPEWLQLQFSSGNFSANANSAMYGQLVVPSGSVTFNSGSVFVGSVTAGQLTINSSGVVFNLPPVIQN